MLACYAVLVRQYRSAKFTGSPSGLRLSEVKGSRPGISRLGGNRAKLMSKMHASHSGYDLLSVRSKYSQAMAASWTSLHFWASTDNSRQSAHLQPS